MKQTFKQASRSYQAFRRPDSDLKSKSMTDCRPGLGLKKIGRPDLSLAKPTSA